MQEFQKTILPIKKKEKPKDAPKKNPPKIKAEVQAINVDERPDLRQNVNKGTDALSDNRPRPNVNRIREIRRPHAPKAIDPKPATEPVKK